MPSAPSPSAQPGLFPAPPRTPKPPVAPPPPYRAPEEQLGLWEEPESVHLTQYRSDRVPDAVPWGPENGNCGPTSAVMALRLAGYDLPGFNGEDSQAAISAARLIGTGATDHGQWTTLGENEKVFTAVGAKVTPASSIHDALAAVRQGKVVMALGNVNSDGYWAKPFMRPEHGDPGWGGHFVVVSRHHAERDRYTVNDPGNDDPVYMTGDELAGFLGDDQAEEPGTLHDAVIIDGPGNEVRNAVTERGA